MLCMSTRYDHQLSMFHLVTISVLIKKSIKFVLPCGVSSSTCFANFCDILTAPSIPSFLYSSSTSVFGIDFTYKSSLSTKFDIWICFCSNIILLLVTYYHIQYFVFVISQVVQSFSTCQSAVDLLQSKICDWTISL